MSENARLTPLRIPTPRTVVVGSRLVLCDKTASTNLLAWEAGGDGTVVIAETQTAGKGRHGRSWHSAPGLGLWFSIALEDALDGISLAAALAVRNALDPICAPAIKWPNDLLLDGKKFCGILVEQRSGRTVVGIGINVHHRPDDFPPDLKDKATSVEWGTGRSCDRGAILHAVLTAFDEQVMVLRSGDYDRVREEWADACRIKGRMVRSDGLEGTVVDIDTQGALVLRTRQGDRRLISGEIHVVEGV